MFERPIAGTLGATTLAIWVAPFVWIAWRRWSARSTA
jgi:hypothetical protein